MKHEIIFGVFFENNIFKLYFDRAENKNFVSYDTEKIINDILYTEDFSSNTTLFENFCGSIKKIECFSYTDIIKKLSEEDYIDFKYTDFYSYRECSSACPSATIKEYNELNTENKKVYCPRVYGDDNENGTKPFCKFHLTNIDPFTNEQNVSFCSGTTKKEINSNYPRPKDFGKSMIMSTHYKIYISLTEKPLSETAVIEEGLTRLIYSIFEFVRPITRVANYVEEIQFLTDFSGNASYLYSSYNKINWISRLTAEKQINDDSLIFEIGGDTFETSSDTWIIKHTFDSYDILCQCFDENDKMVFPARQYPQDRFTYVIEWGNKDAKGFALLNLTKFKALFTEYHSKPFEIIHGLHSITEPDVIQMQNYKKQKEVLIPMNYQEQRDKLYVGLLEKYKDESAVLINSSDKYFSFPKKQKEWIIDAKDLKYWGNQVQVFDLNFNVINPQHAILFDNKTIKITFDKARAGYLGVKSIGNPHWQNDIIEDIIEKDENGKFKGKFVIGQLKNQIVDKTWGKNFHKSSFDGKKIMQSSDLKYIEISDFIETRTYYQFEFIINTYQLGDLNINEIGLLDKNNNLCFYSVGDTIFYPKEFSFKCYYRISKKDLIVDRNGNYVIPLE